MAPTDVPAPDAITHDEFTALLDEYPSLVEKISQTKGSKPGQKTLQQLDEYRYGTAIANFGAGASSPKEMTLEDAKLLVEWKLRHGKFRPMLMGLASSSSADASSSSPSAAAVAAALTGLSKLRGIGPATASLLLSVHDPTRVIFFSDEAFYWLCGDGKVTKLKYSNREYEMLRRNMESLVQRLRVSATEVEKVAYVLFKRDGPESAESDEKAEAAPKAAKAAKDKKSKKTSETETTAKTAKATENKAKSISSVKKAPAKRKRTKVNEDEQAAGTRRSKRVKK
ncbi:ADA HAT complex component 1 [Beauveria brongniartii RCEF 3172]|uniref:ADA HAT complex component 1 n=1 Tax=Beauveria brongniartii RCEF 3172 TaxID=1081107 RepID=A0A167EWS3_9HYPO|nr:ADA HAT complex component 1 [Beauveria brongniartii RCEF 3172]